MTEVLKHLRALENENSNLKEKLEITLYEKIELLTMLKSATSRLVTYEKEIENLKYIYADEITDLEMENFKLKQQLRKQKRERCLAMAKACNLMLVLRPFFPHKEYIRKWVERGNKWIDLADKFKG